MIHLSFSELKFSFYINGLHVINSLVILFQVTKPLPKDTLHLFYFIFFISVLLVA